MQLFRILLSTPMDKAFLAEMQARLEKERTELETELKHLGSTHAGPDAVYVERGSDEDSNAQEVTEFQEDLSLEASLEISLGEVKEALKRMEDGAYGICDECGKPIAEERLKALPRATRCLSCEKG